MMLNDIVVSIIIPAYNAEKYIYKCVSSVISQSFHNLEIIVVNDGSKDKTLEVLKKLENSDPRILVLNQKNAGLPAARNSGLKVATGDYIFFLDSDDWLENNCIETLVDEAVHSGAEIIFFDYFKNFCDKQVEHHAYKEERIEFGTSQKKYSLYNMKTITAWGKLYLKESISDLYYDEKMKTAEDVDFNYRIYGRVKKAVFINKCLLHYRILEKSAIHGYDQNIRDKFNYPIKTIAAYMKNGNLESLKAYYSFVAIAYILICQNGIVLDPNNNFIEQIRKIKEFNKVDWVEDLFKHLDYVCIPFSRKSIILSSKYRVYFWIVLAVNIRRILKR